MSKMYIKASEDWEQLDFSGGMGDTLSFVWECSGESTDPANLASFINNFFNNGTAGTMKLMVVGRMGLNPSSSTYINITSPNTRMAICLIDFEGCHIPDINALTTTTQFIRILNNACVSITGLKTTCNSGQLRHISIGTSNNVYLNNCSLVNLSNLNNVVIYIESTALNGVITINNCYIKSDISPTTAISFDGIQITNNATSTVNIDNINIDVNVNSGVISGVYCIRGLGTTKTMLNLTNSTINIKRDTNASNTNLYCVYCSSVKTEILNSSFTSNNSSVAAIHVGNSYEVSLNNCYVNSNSICLNIANNISNYTTTRILNSRFIGGTGISIPTSNLNKIFILNGNSFNNTVANITSHNSIKKYNIESNIFNLSSIHINSKDLTYEVSSDIYMPEYSNFFNATVV